MRKRLARAALIASRMQQRSTLGSRSPPSLLPHFLVALYGLAIVYASLQPFAPWIAPPPGHAVLPVRAVAAALDALRRRSSTSSPTRRSVSSSRWCRGGGRRSAGSSVAIAAGAALSFALETLQMFLPPRDASAIDLIANTAGAALGGVVGGRVRALGRPRSAASCRVRERWFVPGRSATSASRCSRSGSPCRSNPGIPLFAIVFDPACRSSAPPARCPAPATPTSPPRWSQGAHSAFQLLGVGLFLSLLLRERRYVGGAVLLLIGAALLVKGVAAAVLLKPAAWEHWLSPGVSTGVAAGALLLLAAIWLPRPAQVAMATVALLSSLLTTLLAPDLLFARAAAVGVRLVVRPPAQLQRPHAHRCCSSGRFAASAYLFALAGQPELGRAAT